MALTADNVAIQSKLQALFAVADIVTNGDDVPALFQNEGGFLDFAQVVERAKLPNVKAQLYLGGLTGLQLAGLFKGAQHLLGLAQLTLGSGQVSLQDFLALKLTGVFHGKGHFCGVLFQRSAGAGGLKGGIA